MASVPPSGGEAAGGGGDMPTVHPWVRCDGCSSHPIVGARWKCLCCADIDLCARCVQARWSNATHSSDHEMLYFPLAKRQVLTTASHPGASCGICGREDFPGALYTCTECPRSPTWCERCEVSNLHDPSHVRVKRPAGARSIVVDPVPVPPVPKPAVATMLFPSSGRGELCPRCSGDLRGLGGKRPAPRRESYGFLGALRVPRTAFFIDGICAAPFTPFDDDGSLNLVAATPAQADELVRQGVRYAFLNGTTGEGLLLTVEERKATLEAWMRASRGRISCISMVGAEAEGDVIELARHAAAAGAAAIAYQPPRFFAPDGSPDSILALLEPVANAVPGLPVYYYHIPSKSGVPLRCDALLEAVAAAQDEGRLTNFVGVVYCDADLHGLASCLAVRDGAFDVAYGKDEQLLGALAMGARGAVGSTYNYCGAVPNALVRSFFNGDIIAAFQEQRKLQQVVDVFTKPSPHWGPTANVEKAIQEMRLQNRVGGRGGLVFSGAPRRPGVRVSPEGMAKLFAALDAIGFFEW